MNHLIKNTRTLLSSLGMVEGVDYVWSLAGPTIILTISGAEKYKSLDASVLDRIAESGVEVIGN